MKLLLLIYFGLASAMEGPYTFYRNMDNNAAAGGTRRVFGGNSASLDEFPTSCVLTKWNGKIKCTGAIVAATFVLTAAHCVTRDLRKVRYNTKYPNTNTGDTANIKKLYRHPGYRVVEKDEGRGMDVTELYHDIGLVETEERMLLSIPLKADPLAEMSHNQPLVDREVKVMGFGRREMTENSLGEELFSVHLLVHSCHRSTWMQCGCGVSEPGARTRGVCSGDSGGPVLRNGIQVGVTSMGPIECVTKYDPSQGSTSVFTFVSTYMEVVNNTITDSPVGLKMATVAMSGSAIEFKYFCDWILLLSVLLINWSK